jgi:hypothetical protein
MRLSLMILVTVVLIGLHLAVCWAVLHPKVTREYKAYYIDRTSRDWRVTKYHSTPEDGIDLTKPGWPEFVAYSFGLARDASVGAWTDTRLGLKAGFEFNQPFAGQVCVLLNAIPSSSMTNRRVPLVFGDQQQEIAFGADQSVRLYAIHFELPHPATRLQLLFPKPLPRMGHTDARQLGVGLARIRLLPQPCSGVSDLR